MLNETSLWDSVKHRESAYSGMVKQAVTESLEALGDDIYKLEWATVCPEMETLADAA